jgi:hypothetical protein
MNDHKGDSKRIIQRDVDSEETEKLDENGWNESEVLDVHYFPRSARLVVVPAYDQIISYLNREPHGLSRFLTTLKLRYT